MRIFIILILGFLSFSKPVLSSYCNTNDDCDEGRICLGNQQFTNDGVTWEMGDRTIDDKIEGTVLEGSYGEIGRGTCVQNGVTVGICKMYNLGIGKLARVIVAFALIALGPRLFAGKLEWKDLMLIVIAIGMIFGSFQIIRMIVGGRSLSQTCKDV